MPSASLLQRDLGAREDDGQLHGDGGEGVGHAALGEPPAGVHAGPQRAPECAADREADHRRVDQRLNHDPSGRGEMGDPQVGLQLAEDQLDLQARGVGLGDLGRREHRDRHVGHVPVVLSGVAIADADDAEDGPLAPGAAQVAAARELDLDEEIDDRAGEPGLHVAEPLADERARGAPPAPVLGEDDGTDVVAQPAHEEAAVLLDAREELPLEIAQVEEQEATGNPRADAESASLVDGTEGGSTYVYTYDDWFQTRVVKAEAFDVSILAKELVTETSYDASGRPVLMLGPYYVASGYPLSSKPARSLAYDSLGRLVAIARQPINGTSVTEGLAAFRYTDYSGATPASVMAYQFAVARSFQVGGPPDSGDVRQISTYMDGLGRSIQVRERLGGTAADPAAAIVQSLTNYRVTGAVLFDGAGRVAASVAPYYSSNAGYQDLTSVSMAPSLTGEVIKGPVQAAWLSYDAQGRQVCSTVRAVTTTLPASAPVSGACTSNFAEDAAYARATRAIYRGTTFAGRPAMGIKTIDPRFTVAGGVPVGPESFVDAAGLLRNVTDAEGNGTTFQYDALGRATATIRQAPGSTRASVTSSVTLDMMGRVQVRTDPNFGGRTFTYDTQSPGLLRAVGFTKTGEQKRYDYDMGRVSSVQFCTAAGVCATDAALTWDLPYSSGSSYAFTAGRLGSASNAQSTLAFSYYDAGAMVRRDQWVSAGAFTFTATRRADGQVKQADFIPAQELGLSSLSIFTSFDSAGRPAQVRAGTSTLWSATAGADGTGAYDAFGNLGAVQVDDAHVQQTWTRGAASGLLAAQSVVIQGATNPVVYNVSGITYRGLFLQGYTDNMNQTVQQYWYSNAGRLVASRAQDSLTAGLKQLSCLGFSTDDKFGPGPSFGNIEIVKAGSGSLTTTNYSYVGSDIGTGASGPDAPTTVGTTSLTYDAFGRVATKGGGAESFSYDLAGRLLSATRTAGQSETLAYDPLGQLVSRTVNGQTTWYLGRMATLTTVAGALQADVHVNVNGGRVASIRVGSSPRTLYLHRDRLTSVVGTTLAGGVRGATYPYGPHGALEASTGDAGDAASELGYAGTLRLTGGLMLMGARIYDPSLKVFLQPDPLAPHSYTYAGGDPINRWDPTGLADQATDKPPKKCIGGELCQTFPADPSPTTMTWTEYVPGQVYSSASLLIDSGAGDTQLMSMGPLGGNGGGTQAGGGFSPGDFRGASGFGGDGGGTGGGVGKIFSHGSEIVGGIGVASDVLRHAPASMRNWSRIIDLLAKGADAAKPFTKRLPWVGVLLDAGSVVEGEISWTHFGLNTGVTVGVAVFPPAWPVGAVYYVTDTAVSNFYPGGWTGYGQDWAGRVEPARVEMSRSVFFGYVPFL